MAAAMAVAGENMDFEARAMEGNSLRELDNHTLEAKYENHWGLGYFSTFGHDMPHSLKTMTSVLWFGITIGTVIFAACLVTLVVDERLREERMKR